MAYCNPPLDRKIMTARIKICHLMMQTLIFSFIKLPGNIVLKMAEARVKNDEICEVLKT